jgi:hypothetical protein
MIKVIPRTVVFVVLAALSLPVYAQGDQDKTDQDKTVATLQVNKGVVMTSTGGEFVSATTGESLIKDERLMVSKDSSATVVYSDHCQRTYDDPGVYKIDANCKAAAVLGSGAAAAVGIVAGVIVTGIIVDSNKCHHHEGENNSCHHPISR